MPFLLKGEVATTPWRENFKEKAHKIKEGE